MSSNEEETLPNTRRQFNFDFIKMIIIFGLIPVHLFERCMLLEDYSVNHIGFTSVDSTISTILEFGDGTIGACMFMFCLGVGLVYSKRITAKFLFKRAWVILATGFGLALLTNTISLIIQSQIYQNPELFNNAIWWLFCCDILNFAFLTFLFFSLVRKLKLPNIVVIAIPVILLIISFFIPKMLFPGNIIATDLVGWFVFQDSGYSFFPFMQWLIFPAQYFTTFRFPRQNQSPLHSLFLTQNLIIARHNSTKTPRHPSTRSKQEIPPSKTREPQLSITA